MRRPLPEKFFSFFRLEIAIECILAHNAYDSKFAWYSSSARGKGAPVPPLHFVAPPRDAYGCCCVDQFLWSSQLGNGCVYPAANSANINRKRTVEFRIPKTNTASNGLLSAPRHNILTLNTLGRWLEIYLFGQRWTQFGAVVPFLQFYRRPYSVTIYLLT